MTANQGNPIHKMFSSFQVNAMRNSVPNFANVFTFGLMLLLTMAVSSVQGQSQVEKALSYKPVQKNFTDYDIPTRDQAKKCKITKTMEKYKRPGFAVTDSSGKLLRLFFDNNRDNSLDSWSYFKDGIEVYRDVDRDFDSRADEFRWLGAAGTRKGIDSDKNGKIDRWMLLSASELAEEVFDSIRTADAARFSKLLVSKREIDDLKLGEAKGDIGAKVDAARNGFAKFARSQKSIKSQSKWSHFGSTRPNMIAKGTLGIEKDLLIYDHAAAVFQNGSKFGNISLGTVVEVSANNWRILELPQLIGEGQPVANGGVFYPSIGDGMPDNTEQVVSNGDSPERMKLWEQYGAVEKKLEKASGASNIAKLEEQRVELMLGLATTSKEKDERTNWIQQMADTATSSYQSNRFPKGLKFLESKFARLRSAGLSDSIPYIEWRMVYAKFSAGHSGDVDRRTRKRANDQYILDLKKFAKDYPKSEYSADALFQLGLNSEVTERDDLDNAIAWYRKCQSQFPKSVFGKKAEGALRRLTGQGKKVPIAGTTINGQRLNVNQYRNKIVIFHYWETWCDSCTEGFDELQRLRGKYRDKIRIVGVNLDEESSKVKTFLTKNRKVTWPQLYSPGGVDRSPLAIQMGIATLPMNILIDGNGNMVESNVPVDGTGPRNPATVTPASKPTRQAVSELLTNRSLLPTKS